MILLVTDESYSGGGEGVKFRESLPEQRIDQNHDFDKNISLSKSKVYRAGFSQAWNPTGNAMMLKSRSMAPV